MIYEASFTGLIRIIFYIIAVSFIIRLIARMALPYVVKNSQEAMKEQARRFYEQQQQQARPARKEGEVTIEKNNSSSKSNGKEEYVDFVEIKD